MCLDLIQKTKKMKILLFAILTPVIILCAIVLRFKLNNEKITYNFERNIVYPENGIRMERADLKYYSYYFAGVNDNFLYLGNSKTSLHLLRVNSTLKDTTSITIKAGQLPEFGNFKISVDSNRFFLSNGIGKSVMKGDTKYWKANLDNSQSIYFTDFIPLNNFSYLYNYVSSNTNENTLRKQSINGKVIDNKNLLIKQVDGLFCTSGMMKYNKQANVLIYMYYYRNQLIVIDTNLKLVKRIKTIDPIDTAVFTTSEFKSNNKSVITSPALVVNARFDIWENYIFVQSKLMGKDEDEQRFNSSTVIDIYDLNNSKYVSSIYIPNQPKEPISDFKVLDSFIYTISDHYINRYVTKLPKR